MTDAQRTDYMYLAHQGGGSGDRSNLAYYNGAADGTYYSLWGGLNHSTDTAETHAYWGDNDSIPIYARITAVTLTTHVRFQCDALKQTGQNHSVSVAVGVYGAGESQLLNRVIDVSEAANGVHDLGTLSYSLLSIWSFWLGRTPLRNDFTNGPFFGGCYFRMYAYGWTGGNDVRCDVDAGRIQIDWIHPPESSMVL